MIADFGRSFVSIIYLMFFFVFAASVFIVIGQWDRKTKVNRRPLDRRGTVNDSVTTDFVSEGDQYHFTVADSNTCYDLPSRAMHSNAAADRASSSPTDSGASWNTDSCASSSDSGDSGGGCSSD